MDPRLPRGLVCFLVVLLPLVVFPGAQGQDDDYIECYEFTWTGKNTSVECGDNQVDITGEPQPCLDTLVYTDPPDQPPNITDLNNHCTKVAKCPSYTCREKKKKCIKLSWLDVTNTMVNYSVFCGLVNDQSDPSSPKEKVNMMYEMQVGTYTKRLWVCDKDYCNAAGALGAPGGVTFMAVVLVPLIVSSLLAPGSSSSSSSFSFLSPVAGSLLVFFKQ